MIERIIQFSIKNKFIVGLFIFALVGWGIYSVTKLPVDATPDITNNQVQIISLAPSLAVQEVESFITAPLEVAVANIPNIIELRSISRLGLSVVTIVFKDNVDIYWARQQLNERIREAEENIPKGLAKIELAPISTGLGEIFQYRLAVAKGFEHKYSAMELRTLQDWVVRREMLGTPGVADINSYGGFVKQYEVAINPDRLRSMNLTLIDIFEALERNNENTGSAYIDKKPTSYFIRGLGLIKTLEDVEKIQIKSSSSGIPVLIRDVATVQYGNAIRYGAFVVDTTEAVGGVVMMLKGTNANEVVKNVETKIATIQRSLPEGVTIEPFLNRADLVDRAIGTVSENLILGALIVIFILVLFLGDIRAGFIVASVIPLSLLFAISLMNIFGVSGNLMSLGAIDFGLIVDGAVIIVESVVHRIFSHKNEMINNKYFPQDKMDSLVLKSAKQMMSSATFGQIIIFIVYLPILALQGIEGKMFRPMAQVVVFALIGAMILSLTYVPVITSVLLKKSPRYNLDFSDKMMNWFQKVFNPMILWSLAHKKIVSISAVLVFVISLFIFSRLGGEFIPQLEEGDLAAGVMTLQGGSLSNTVDMVEKANKILLKNFPEIKHAVCKIGAGEIPTDPTPMETGDYIITLKDKKEWTSAKTREELVAKMEESLVPLAGVKFEFQQPIQMRTNELLSGSKQDIAVKIFGDDLDLLSEKASEIEKIINKIDGVEDINVEKVTGLAQVQVEYNREALSQYGLSVSDVNQILRTAFAGSEAGTVYDGEKRFGLVVRLDKDYRESLDNVKNLFVSLPNGGQITFDQIANVEIKSGPAQISREDTKRRITVGFNVRNRDVQSVIKEISHKIDESVKMPTGYYVTYGGQFQNLEAAKNRLAIAVPVALLLIFVLLFFTFHSAKQALLIFTAVPMSVIGGILALWMRGMNFSISAGVGFIALFGIAVLNGIVLISEFNRLKQEGVADINQRVMLGLKTRLRPVIMTAAVASLGFLPMAISTSAGAEVQRPLATVVIGGLITATILTLIVLPIFYIFFSTRSFRRKFKWNWREKSSAGFILVLFLFGTNQMNAQQKTITLKDAVDMAFKNNPTLKQSSRDVEVQKVLEGTSFDLPKTDIDAEYGQFNSYTKDNSVSISQSFSLPQVYISQHKLAKSNTKSSELMLQISQVDVVAQVKQIYWQMVYLQSKLKLYVFQDSLYSRFTRDAKLRAETGETNRLEMISAKSQSLEMKNKIRQVNADFNISSQKMQLLLNSKTSFIPADTSLISTTYLPLNDSSVLKNNPSSAYSNQQIEIAQRERAVENSHILPEFRIGYNNQSIIGSQDVNGVTKTFSGSNRFQSVQAGISIPLWFGSNQAKGKASKIKEQSAKETAEAYQTALENSYNSLLLQLEKDAGNVNYYQKQAVPEADLIINQAGLSYRAGEMNYLGYIQSISSALDIKENYLDALNNYNQTVISIEQILGKTQ